jgi:hypothetical protein
MADDDTLNAADGHDNLPVGDDRLIGGVGGTSTVANDDDEIIA